MLKKLWNILWKTIRGIVFTVGIIALLMIILSFTRHPYMLMHYMGTANSEIVEDPDFIVVMGAEGIPGAGSLLRCYYGAEAAKAFPEAKIIIAMPAHKNNFLDSDSWKMAEIISQYGIDKTRFMFEYNGTNTYTQACETKKLLQNFTQTNVLVVTAPDHMYRSILTFEKCGFSNVDGWPAFGTSLEKELLLTQEETRKKVLPPSRNINLRYKMWTYLKIEINLIREWLAIAYYKINGYI
jgi:uncharacterized SAM-binding protein YcdF (DUF218 family)